MIYLTRMDKQSFFVNPDHIISIEETPDTVITLFNGHHFIVYDRASDIINKIIAFRSRIIRRAGAASDRKYLNRGRKKQFQSITLNSSTQQLPACENQQRAPFHGLEL